MHIKASKPIFFSIICLVISLIFINSAFAEVTDDSSQNLKPYQPIEVTIGSGKEAKRYLLMNNGLDINRWYYASLNPKLFEYGSPVEPDLMYPTTNLSSVLIVSPANTL